MIRSLTRAAAAVSVAMLAFAVTAPPSFAAPGPPGAPEWWFDSWHVQSEWAQGHDGSGIVIAVADTGVQANVTALSGQVLPGADFTGNGTDGREDFDSEDFSHGTAMASIIVAKDGAFGVEGVAPGAKILPMALPLEGVQLSGGTPTPDATAVSIRWAADHGARIISMSLGGVRTQKNDRIPCPLSMQDAVTYALHKGAIVLAASGNAATSGSPVEEPGVCIGVVSVGAVTQSLDVAAFSSRHPYLTLAAPGDNVPSLNRVDGHAFAGSGTSQATALAAAALALVWSAHPKESNRQILTRVIQTAQDLGTKGHDNAYGWGFVRPDLAIAARTPAASAANPVFDAAAPLLAAENAPQPKLALRKTAGNPKAPLGTVVVGKNVSVLGPRFKRFVGYTVGLALLGIALLAFGLRPRRVQERTDRATPPTPVGADVARSDESVSDAPPGSAR